MSLPLASSVNVTSGTFSIPIGTILGGAITLISGKVLVPRFIYDREKEAADECRKEIARLNALMQENTAKAIPALEAGTAVQVKSAEALAAANQIIRDLMARPAKGRQ